MPFLRQILDTFCLDKLLAKREILRQQKRFSDADKIRDALLGIHIIVTDTREGPDWKFDKGV